MVDFREELVGRKKRPPALEYGVRYLQDSVVDFGVVGR